MVSMNKKRLLIAALFLSAAFFFNVPGTWAQAADNTKLNENDRSNNALTADQQRETKQDREITQRIRKSIIDDKSLSTYAHNVKIITADGMVTLRGPVRSEEEKKSVEQKAIQVAGDGKIRSEIRIAPKNTSKAGG